MCVCVCGGGGGGVGVGICKLCWHNFEHYRDLLAFENNASIIGLFSKHYWANFYICSQILKQADVFVVTEHAE